MFASGKSASVSAVANYIEDVFSTYLYKGNSSTQTITNGINLAGKGGMVWLKRRSSAGSHFLQDSTRGISYTLSSDTTGAQVFNDLTSSFNSNGFGLYGYDDGNLAGQTFSSWTFRKQPKFFDIVTYTGTGGVRTINHNLGSAAGCIMIKCTSTTSNWMVWHRSISGQNNLYLNSTAATSGVAADPISVDGWPSSTSTTTFTVDSGTDSCNTLGETYVAYLFAHDAGGFGLTGSDNVISCGSFTGTTSGALINLGYEPQFVLWKKTNNVGGWFIADSMRGLTSNPPNNGAANTLYANATDAEAGLQFYIGLGSQGFWEDGLGTSDTYIYIAIRRGPMKVPTDATKVLAINLASDTSTAPLTWNTNSTVDSVLTKRNLSYTNGNNIFVDRLRGNSATLTTNSTNGESTNANITDLTISNGYIQKLVSNSGFGSAVTYAFSRAPSFFDEVCYTGDGTYPSARAIPHNLTVAPEIIIYKCRSTVVEWEVNLNISTLSTKRLYLNSDGAGAGTSLPYGGYAAAPTATNIYVRDAGGDVVNGIGQTYVAYLFATCAGVSKVGSYTGTGATQTISCGFTGGARFVLVKRTDSTGDWYVLDTTRGMVAGTDPSLLLNNTAAEVNANSIYTTTGGFQIVSTASGINASGGTYIFLAIA